MKPAITASVASILQQNRLVTIREGNLADFRPLRARARRGQVEVRTAPELLVTLFERKVENHADILEDIHRQPEAVSYLVLEGEKAELDESINFPMDFTQGFINIEQNGSSKCSR